MAAQRRNRVQATYTLDPEVVDRVREAAWSNRMSASRFVEQAIVTFLAEHPDMEPPSTD